MLTTAIVGTRMERLIYSFKGASYKSISIRCLCSIIPQKTIEMHCSNYSLFSIYLLSSGWTFQSGTNTHTWKNNGMISKSASPREGVCIIIPVVHGVILVHTIKPSPALNRALIGLWNVQCGQPVEQLVPGEMRGTYCYYSARNRSFDYSHPHPESTVFMGDWPDLELFMVNNHHTTSETLPLDREGSVGVCPSDLHSSWVPQC